MGTYNSAVITTAGQSLLARAIADSLPFYFTSAKTTEYIVPSGTSAASLTELPNIKQSEEITSATVTGTSQVSTSVRFDNTDITLTYSINTVGVYAKAGTDANETLLAVITAQTADVMPSYSATNPVAYVYSINLAISNASNINIIVSPTGAPNHAEFDELGAEVEALDAEVKNARIGADGVTYPSAGDATRANDLLLKSQLDALSNQPVFEFVIGRIIASSGSEGNNDSGAHTQQIPVSGGDIVFRLPPAQDNNGNILIVHVCQYSNGVFKSRTSLTVSRTNNPITLASDTDSIVFNFSREISSGVVMTQADLDTYFSVFVYRKASLEVDQHTMLAQFAITQSEATTEYESLLSNVPSNTFVWIDKRWWNDSPKSTSNFFYMFSFAYSTRRGAMTTQGTQIAVFPDDGVVCTRRIKSGSWTPWTSTNGAFPTYYAFGDSVTWGAVWDSDQSTDLYQADYNDQIPTRIAHAIGSANFVNNGVSGARFVKQPGDSASSKTIVDRIKETNFNNVDIITIGGGRNDSATALGSVDTSTANDGTICGAVIDVLEYLVTNYPKLQIVMYGVTPQPTSTSHEPEHIFTRVFAGGWSLNTYYEEMRKVCAKYGVPFIDWYDCTLILRWGVLSGGYSGGIQNWSHPLSSDIYRQMGNYLAGRISAYYSG